MNPGTGGGEGGELQGRLGSREMPRPAGDAFLPPGFFIPLPIQRATPDLGYGPRSTAGLQVILDFV
jgi:hypothetical protein